MFRTVDHVAVVGAGVAGLAAAIRLADAGVRVDLYEARPGLNLSGSGITLQGNALRIFDRLGIWEDLRAHGYPFEGLKLRAPGPDAAMVADLPDVKTGGPDYPACMGMYRPDLARVMLARAEAVGVDLHFGSEVSGLEQTGETVQLQVGKAGAVADTGDVAGPFDLVIGADGLHSAVRSLIGIDVEPVRNGMGIWRVSVARPPEVSSSELYYGGPVYIAGYTPTSESTIYAFLVEKAQERDELTNDERVEVMIAESAAYGGPWNHIRRSLETGDVEVNYTRFTSHLVPSAWNRGSTVIIGDAAHTCPPTIAQGAAQSLEDASVLTELLLGNATDDAPAGIDDGLWAEFHARRLPRAQAVVDASAQLAQWQLDGDTEADSGRLIFDVARTMAEPA
ncbi:FAD-binding protein [Brevibacterium permense]|uniref:FAD-dependent monooxygenase n=1 Tax=Brevibacterium permense TaxID=234834 RepID=UPI0021CE629A|nr:FAD-dependent monooxygenase [Brevibacterium permense]MCU4298238.1 FAD-binding protein [Brevibacterium permense]